MRNLLYIVVLFVAAACSAGGTQDDHGLDEAAALIQSDPATAMERLNGFDVAAFSDSAVMARWALLYSEALVANRISAPSDTIVDIAIDYYGSHNRPEEFRHASRLKTLLHAPAPENALAGALYLQKEKEYMLYREHAARRMTVLVAALVLLAAIAVIVWQRQRMRVKDARAERLVAEASSLKNGMLQNRSLCSDRQAKLERLLSTRFDVIDSLCGTYFESQGTKTERKAIADKVRAHIAEIRSDSGLFADMERCVNDCRDGLLVELRHQLPSISSDDYRLMVYLSCHLSNRSIAALLDENIDVVYKRKSRLKSRLAALGPQYSARFLSVFS